MSNQQPTQRQLAWEACYNARDLGGLPTVDGGYTRWQAVIRTDLLSRLTAQGKRALLDYGVRTIIDLRGPKEVQDELRRLLCERTGFAANDPKIEGVFQHPWKEHPSSWR